MVKEGQAFLGESGGVPVAVVVVKALEVHPKVEVLDLTIRPKDFPAKI